jgi:hypothetical protein
MSAIVHDLPMPEPEPGPDRHRDAEVIELWRHQPYRSTPTRRSVNGHHADCATPHSALPEHCSVCEGIRKGATR